MAIPSGEIYLLKDVPLTPLYEHTIDFADKTEQRAYFNKFIKFNLANEAYSYIRKEREYLIVELPLAALDDVNYMLFRSADGERLYYAFVTDKTYVNDVTSHVYYEIDVMQTYAFDYEWKASYIKQAHVDRWDAQHKPIYSKTDEGLDYGTEYSVENGFRIEQSTNVKWALVSMDNYFKSADGTIIEYSTDSLGRYNNVFEVLMVPIIENDSITEVWCTNTSTASKGIGTYSDLCRLMKNSDIGNFIKSITILPYNPLILSEYINDNKLYVTLRNGVYANQLLFNEKTGINDDYLLIFGVRPSLIDSLSTLAITEWDNGLDSLPTSNEWEEIKAKPYTTKRDKRFESKLLCYPYRYNLLTDWRNCSTVFKNEYMTNDKIEVKFKFALTYNSPFRYYLKNYKKDVDGRYTTFSQAIAPEMPIINDAYYTYMLENRNTIKANMTNSMVNAASGIVSGAIAGGGVGGPGGAAFGAVSGAISGALNIQAQIRSENAKQQDLKSIPDSFSGTNDSVFALMDKTIPVYLYRMRICCENEEILAEIFNMSGYKVNRVEIPNTRSRTRFNYIQTMGANIVGSFSQNDLVKIKNIYDKGITIWHYNSEAFNFLDYSFENLERNLL